MKRILAHTHKKTRKEKTLGRRRRKNTGGGRWARLFFNAEAIRCCVCAITKGKREDDGQVVVAAGK
jgi:hypothetical protein